MSFDSWKTTAPEDDGVIPEPEACRVCTGHEDAPVCSPECARIEWEARRITRIKALYATCRTAMNLARIYQRESGAEWREDPRIVAIRWQVNSWRRQVAAFRCLTQEVAEVAIARGLREDMRTASTMPAPANDEAAQ